MNTRELNHSESFNAHQWKSENIEYVTVRKLFKNYQNVLMEKNKHSRIKIEILSTGNVTAFSESLFLDFWFTDMPAEVINYKFDEWIFDNEIPRVDISIFWFPRAALTIGETQFDAHRIENFFDEVDKRIQRGISIYILLPESGNSSQTYLSSLEKDIQEFKKSMRKRYENTHGVSLIEPEIWIPFEISRNWQDLRMWEVLRSPGNLDSTVKIAKIIGNILRNDLGFGIKAIAVDLDGTLWRGIVGDDGVDGINLDSYGLGRFHLELQRFLVDQHNQGIYLGLLSKNSEQIVREVFNNRNEMILQSGMISYWGVNWREKSENLIDMSKFLNIGLNSIVFLDDSEFEIYEVRSKIPEVNSFKIDNSDYNQMWRLSDSGLFNKTRNFADNKTTTSFALNQFTHANKSSSNFRLSINIHPVSSSNIDRVSSLINKTNQFNLTSARTSRSKLLDYSHDEGCFAKAFEITENGISAGIMSTIIAVKRQGVAEILEWVQSCRSFSRGIEWYTLKELSNWASQFGIEQIYCKLAKTDRTSYLEDFMDELRAINVLDSEDKLQVKLILNSERINERAFRYVNK